MLNTEHTESTKVLLLTISVSFVLSFVSYFRISL